VKACGIEALPGFWMATEPFIEKSALFRSCRDLQNNGLMNWRHLQIAPWLDTRARFVSRTPRGGALLDIGASDGETLGHFSELRPDLQFYATDIEGRPENYPKGTQFHRGDIQTDPLPWAGAQIHAATCMHLIEHLRELDNLSREVLRVLKPGGLIYFETPHPKTVLYDSPPNGAAASFTLNFFDDITHTRPVRMGGLAKHLSDRGFVVLKTGVSRNWLFALSYALYFWRPSSRKKFTAKIHWQGWSAYLIARKPK
jgi:O-antigen chain-terminating methyltransferase